MTSQSLDALWRRRNTCTYCKVPTILGGRGPTRATVDHVVPRSAGGPNLAWNRVLACGRCNSAKGSMDVIQFRALLKAGAIPSITLVRRDRKALKKLFPFSHLPAPKRAYLRAASLAEMKRTGTNLGDVLRASGVSP